MDIASFFITVHRPTLKDLILSSVPDRGDPKEAALRWLAGVVYDHDARQDFYDVVLSSPRSASCDAVEIPRHRSWLSQPADRGIPIGNLTSQFASGVILTGLDHYIARKLRPGTYVRYMDDLLLLGDDFLRLQDFIPLIGTWIQRERFQTLNHSKTVLTPLADGIDFLGRRLRQINRPANPLLVEMERSKMWKLVSEAMRLERSGLPPSELVGLGLYTPLRCRSRTSAAKAAAALNSRLGDAVHAASFRFRKRTLTRLAGKEKFSSCGKVRKDFAAIRPL